MSESKKFTPGPWEVLEDIRYQDKESQYTAGFDICNFDGISVVGCEGISGDSETDRSNARLIAAAPDLLESAERYLDFMHDGQCGMGYQFSGVHPQTQLKNAIIKARGQQ